MTESLLKIIRGLGLQNQGKDALKSIPYAQWPKLLKVTDRARITLALGLRCGEELPEWVQARIGRDILNNSARHRRAIVDYQEIAGEFRARNIDFIVLKGLSQWPHYADRPDHRPQYDLDLFCPPEALERARDTLRSLGYEPAHGGGDARTDHLPPMIRKTGWTWRGDYYDPEMPLSVELHFRFWDRDTECFPAASGESFWQRRTVRFIEDLHLPTLDAVDGLSYSAWHLVRHLLRGDLRVYHVYELAYFLDRTAADSQFWRRWREQAEPPSQKIEALAFRLATEWFDCRIHPLAQDSIEELPGNVRQWFRLFAFSPIQALSSPNKDELFLHFCLAGTARARWSVAARRIVPSGSPGLVLDAHAVAVTPALRARRICFRALFMACRMLYHARSVPPLVRSALRWYVASCRSSAPASRDNPKYRAGTVPP